MEKEGFTSLSLFWYNRGKKTRLEEMIFDTHTHLNIEEFAGREAEEIALAAEMGVTQMNIVGFDNRPLSEP
jgi:tatD family DNase